MSENDRAAGQERVVDSAESQPSREIGGAQPTQPSMMGAVPPAVMRRMIQRRLAQRKGNGDISSDTVHAAAEAGTQGASRSLPHLDQIQKSFGRHDVSAIQAHTDDRASAASKQMGAEAFASGNHVAFAGAPSLHTAAHEAAHVVQQQSGVHLAGGVGAEGDAHEQHADAVADAVVAGRSAEGLLDQRAGDRKFAASGHGVQRKVILGKKDVTDVSVAIRAMTGIAEKLGLQLDFDTYAETIGKLVTDDEHSVSLDDARMDGSGYHIVNIYNQVSGKKLTPETAPKAEKKEKLKREGEKKDEKMEKVDEHDKSPKIEKQKKTLALEDLVKEALITDRGSGKFGYAWGGTGRVEKALREVFPEEMVIKSSDGKTGLRNLAVKNLVFLETPSTLPTGGTVELDEADHKEIKVLVEAFALAEDQDAVHLVEELYRYSKATKLQPAAIAKQLKRLLVSIRESNPVEGSGVAHWVGKIYRRGLITTLAQGDPEKIPYQVLVNQVKGTPQVPANPQLLKHAEQLATKTDILRSATWLSARTDEEFNGLTGEYIARQEFGEVMPKTDLNKFEKDSQPLSLHSVHFIGDLYRDSTKARQDTDVCSELDLMSVVSLADKSFVCVGLGNVKVTSLSAVPEAQTQNNVAEEALRAHVGGRRAKIDEKKKETADVKQVFGYTLEGQKIDLTGKLKVGEVSKTTVGAKKGSGNYDTRISLTYAEVSGVSLLLREHAHRTKE